MFDLRKKSNFAVAAVSGKILDLEQVPDEVFASKLVGDGVAIDCCGEVVVSPVEGILSLIFDTNHAFAITTKGGVELLVHIGIDTVELNGEGFNRLLEEGSKVNAGEPIIKINNKFIKKKGYSLITMVLITNMEKIMEIKTNKNIDVIAGENKVFTYKIK